MKLNERVAQKAAELGFTGFGVCSAEPFEDWKRANETRHAMGHGRLIPVQADPQEVLPGARAILVVTWPYRPFEELPAGSVFVPAYYFADTKANRALNELVDFLKAEGVSVKPTGRIPLKAAAVRAGVGSYTHHGLLVREGEGTYTVIKAMLTDSDAFDFTEAAPDICSGCGACREHCPTGAIQPDGHTNINLCLREMMRPGVEIETAYYETVGNRVLGCEECQLCCPCNRMERDSYTDEMAKLFSCETLLGAEGEAREAAERDVRAFMGSYGDYENLRSHAILAAGNTGDKKYLPDLQKIAETEEGANQRYARWAIAKISGAAES